MTVEDKSENNIPKMEPSDVLDLSGYIAISIFAKEKMLGYLKIDLKNQKKFIKK